MKISHPLFALFAFLIISTAIIFAQGSTEETDTSDIPVGRFVLFQGYEGESKVGVETSTYVLPPKPVILKLDTTSGKTWIYDKGRWYETKE